MVILTGQLDSYLLCQGAVCLPVRPQSQGALAIHHTISIQLHQALTEGAVHASVYHAMGNALVQQNHKGHALAAWHRSLRLEPSSQDVRSNLKLLSKKEGFEPPDESWRTWLPARWLMMTSSLSLMAMFLLWWRRGFSAVRRSVLSLGAAALGFGILTSVSLQQQQSGIVISHQVVARSSMGGYGIDLFQLPLGSQVRLHEKLGEDLLISSYDGQKGWVSESSVVSLDPGADFPLP